MSGSSSPQTSSQSVSPWAPQQPFIQRGFQDAFNALQTPPSLSPRMRQALNNMWSQNSDLNLPTSFGAAQSWGQKFLGSNPMNANDPTFQAAEHSIIPQVEGQFAGAGMLNSGLAKTAETSALSDAFAKQNMAQNQLKAQVAGQLPQIATQGQNYLQNKLNNQFQVGNFETNFNNNSRMQQILDYMKAVGGNYGSESTGTVTPASGNNPLEEVFGGGLLGLSALNNVGGLSGLASLFSL